MLKLEIVTPERKVVETEAESVTLPTASGEAGILPQHAPLVSALKPGVLAYANRGAIERVAVGGGFVEVSNDRVSVLTDSAETADEIDPAATRALLESAQRELAETINHPIEDTEAIRDQVEAANARLQLASGK